MGTYTTNYNLFMPSVGEQGWGTLVNGNFTTIDSAMAGLNTRVGTLETEMDAVEERVTILEAGNFESVTAETFNGDLYVNVSTTEMDNNIGEYIVNPDSNSKQTSQNGKGTFTGPTINILDVSSRFKRGFKPTEPYTGRVTGTISWNHSTAATIGLSGISLYVYLNGELLTSISGSGTAASFSTSFETDVHAGDTITTTLYNSSFNATTHYVTLRLTSVEGKYCLAY